MDELVQMTADEVRLLFKEVCELRTRVAELECRVKKMTVAKEDCDDKSGWQKWQAVYANTNGC